MLNEFCPSILDQFDIEKFCYDFIGPIYFHKFHEDDSKSKFDNHDKYYNNDGINEINSTHKYDDCYNNGGKRDNGIKILLMMIIIKLIMIKVTMI